MKHHPIFIFLFIVLALYGGLNFYYIKRSAQALCGLGLQKTIIIAVLIAFSLSFLVGRFIEIYFRNWVTHVLIVAGSFYFGFLFYAVLATAIADIVRLCQYFLHFLPRGIVENPYKFLHALWFSLAGCIVAALCVGYWINMHPRIKTYDLVVPKKSSKMSGITIAAVSDIHFGTVFREPFLKKITLLVKQVNPDIILFLGDLFDEKVSDAQRCQMTEFLKNLSCPLGVYAIIGNHDHFSGLQKVVQVLNEANITLLQDSVVVVDGAFLLIGRKDLSVKRMGSARKSLHEILVNAHRDLPLILMDHQPFHLEEAQKNEIDLQLSGHTHHGQLFPLNLLYRWIYEKSWGYLRKGKTQIIVSCGAGTWGPPMRTNSIPEVLQIRLKFVNE